MTREKSESERAREAKRRTRESQAAATVEQDKLGARIHEIVREYVADAGDAQDSKIEALRELVTVPAPAAPPTRPSPEALAASRREPTDPPLPSPPPAASGYGERPPTSGPRVLVIDDSGDHRAAVRGVLEDAGYNVAEAVDGLQGFVRSQQLPHPDLILLDLEMPVWGGVRFVQEFDRTELAHLPVFFISGHTCPADLAAYCAATRESEVEAHRVYLGKPLNADRLIAQVKRAVGESRAMRAWRR